MVLLFERSVQSSRTKTIAIGAEFYEKLTEKSKQKIVLRISKEKIIIKGEIECNFCFYYDKFGNLLVAFAPSTSRIL